VVDGRPFPRIRITPCPPYRLSSPPPKLRQPVLPQKREKRGTRCGALLNKKGQTRSCSPGDASGNIVPPSLLTDDVDSDRVHIESRVKIASQKNMPAECPSPLNLTPYESEEIDLLRRVPGVGSVKSEKTDRNPLKRQIDPHEA